MSNYTLAGFKTRRASSIDGQIWQIARKQKGMVICVTRDSETPTLSIQIQLWRSVAGVIEPSSISVDDVAGGCLATAITLTNGGTNADTHWSCTLTADASSLGTFTGVFRNAIAMGWRRRELFGAALETFKVEHGDSLVVCNDGLDNYTALVAPCFVATMNDTAVALGWVKILDGNFIPYVAATMKHKPKVDALPFE